uniref:PDZ domain-containing protein n=1 Tax=Anopheles atroparvus TaxID=41427 RepID=A0A182ISA4_ANOAO
MSSKSNSTASNGSTATATMASNGTPKYEARLCHVVKRPDFDGYGFNLHAEKGRPGQYIGKVDDASPAEGAGLRQGDRIIEVNGTNITTETHKKVVELIKAVPNETRLLVLTVTDGAAVGKMALNGTATAQTNGNGTASTEPSKAEGKKLNLPMTAAEMRAQLAARKKYDPKSEVCDLRKKYEIIQKIHVVFLDPAPNGPDNSGPSSNGCTKR